MRLKTSCWLLSLLLLVSTAHALTLTEGFEDRFPLWESSWLGVNSDLQNYYGTGEGRGNNPDGLWISRESITFNPTFGRPLTSLALDVASWVYYNLNVYDASDALIYSSDSIAPNFGAYSDPGFYDRFSISSTNGISKFSFLGFSILGNLSIDNVTVSTDRVVAPVPEPPTLLLLAAGMVGLYGYRRKRI